MSPGPLNALRRIGANSATLLLSRAEFAALELAQARGQMMRWLLLALAAAVAVQFALVAGAAALTALLWERFGPYTLLALCVVASAAGVWLVVTLRKEIGDAPPVLSQTLSELGKDRDAFFGRAAPADGRHSDSAKPGAEHTRDATH